MSKQVVAIHGGHTYATYEAYLAYLRQFDVESLDYFRGGGWKSGLQKALGASYDVILPRMPNAQNAKYVEWKIWFEKLLPFLKDWAVFLGHSLGGIFLAKYLSENDVPRKIAGLFLVAAPYMAEGSDDDSLADFELTQNLEKVSEQVGTIFLYFSKDDPAVPFFQLAKYQAELPEATVRVFDDRGHFNQEEFPEIVEDIKNLA
jgi:uncharacterized protein